MAEIQYAMNGEQLEGRRKTAAASGSKRRIKHVSRKLETASSRVAVRYITFWRIYL
jgi:hypothetical protein